MTGNSSHSRWESTVGSGIATFDVAEPETDPAFYHNNCLTIYCTIGSQLSKKGPNTGLVMFRSQSDWIPAKNQIEETMVDQFLRCFATLQENTTDWVLGSTHTLDTIPDQSTDLRMHIAGILYHSRAASLGILSSIGGCVSTTTSTHTAPTTTTTRRQQLLLAEFLSGG